jgi:hypothetical protein
MRVCDLILGSPFDRIRLADRLEEAVRWLWAKPVAQWEADAELEALQSFAARVHDIVLESPDETSSLAMSLSSAVEQIKDCIVAMATNGVCWGTRSMLVATLSHFPELGTKLELLGSGCSVDLMEGQVDAL